MPMVCEEAQSWHRGWFCAHGESNVVSANDSIAIVRDADRWLGFGCYFVGRQTVFGWTPWISHMPDMQMTMSEVFRLDSLPRAQENDATPPHASASGDEIPRPHSSL